MSFKSMEQCHKIDRMSDLPDSIILHILTFMDTKDAVRSGVLSKRFANLWTEAPCLNFERSTMKNVCSTVSFHKRSNLEKVSVIKIGMGENFSDSLTEFFRFLELLGLVRVKEFILDLKYRGTVNAGYFLPQDFYSNPFLKKLTLTNGCLNTNGFVNWSSLQSLSLSKVLLPPRQINDILSGCPSIELLVLYKCYFDCPINLTNNRSLRKLEIYRCFIGDTLEILAPYLQSLVLLGYTKWSKCKLFNVNSLTHCCLGFYVNMDLVDKRIVIQGLTSLLDDLSHIETVTIGKWVLRVLSLMELNELPCPMASTIKLLKLRSSPSFTTDDMTGIACLLRNLNRLEKLVIEIRYDEQPLYLPCFLKQDQVCLKNKSYCSSGILENLKTVEILGLREDRGVQLPYNLSNILLLLEFLLKKAEFLENMIISARGSTRYIMELKRKLLGFQKSSCAVIKVIDC